MTVKHVRPFLHAALLIPLLYYAYRLFTADLGADPAEKLNEAFGALTMRLLLINLIWGALIHITKLNVLRRFSILRRPLGVWTFIYAVFHVIFYFIKENDWSVSIPQVYDKLYLNFGAIAWIILGLLAITSNDFALRKLKPKKWKNLHRLVYVAFYLGVAHYALIEKADPRWTVIYGLPLTVLYLFRLIQSIASSRFFKRPSN